MDCTQGNDSTRLHGTVDIVLTAMEQNARLRPPRVSAGGIQVHDVLLAAFVPSFAANALAHQHLPDHGQEGLISGTVNH